MEVEGAVKDFFVGDLMAAAETGEWRARDAEWWRGLTRKRRGEMAEAAFVAKAVSLGFGVAKTWGDSDPFDFIVQSGGKLLKVQVKSAHCVGEDGTYSIRAHGHDMKAYRADQIDVLVAFVVPLNVWYVFPVRALRRMRSLKLFPGSRKRRSKYEKYREA